MGKYSDSISNPQFVDALDEFCDTINSYHPELQISFAKEISGEELGIPFAINNRSAGYLIFKGNAPDDAIKQEVKLGLKQLIDKFYPLPISEVVEEISGFDGLINISPIPQCLIDVNLCIIRVNEEFGKLFGIKPGDRADSVKQIFMLESDNKKLKKKITAGKKIKQSRVLLKADDGNTFYAELTVKNIIKEDFTLYLCAFYDVTNLAVSEKKYREKESQYRSLVEQSITGIYIVQDENIKYINPQFAEIFGYEQNEILGMHYTELIYEPDVHRVKERMAKRLTDRKPQITYKFRGKRKDGKIITLRAHGTVGPYKGKPAVIGTLTDITKDIIKAEDLKQSEAKFKTLTENSPVAILIYQEENIVYANPVSTEITGYSNEELLQMKFWDVVHPKDRELVKSRGLKRQRGDEIPNRYKFRLLSKSGEVKWIDFSGTLISINNQPAGIIVATDITKAILSKEKLRTINDLLATINEINKLKINIDELENYFYDVCKILISTGIYKTAWFGLFNSKGAIYKIISPDSQIDEKYNRKISEGIIPHCVKEIIIRKEMVQIDSVNDDCSDCVLSGLDYDGALVLDRIMNLDKKIAVLALLHDKEKIPEEDEKKLISELTQHISSKYTEERFRRDLTESNREYSEIQERYTSFINNTTEGIYRIEFGKKIKTSWSPDKQAESILEYGYIAECNSAFAKFYGQPFSSSLFGRKLNSLYANEEQAVSIQKSFVENAYLTENEIWEEYLPDGSLKYFNNNNFAMVQGDEILRIWGIKSDVTSQYLLNETIKDITIGSESRSGEEFLEYIVLQLRKAMNADFAFIGEYSASKRIIKTRVVSQGNQLRENFDYALPDTPCADVIDNGIAVFPENVSKMFPDFPLIIENEINGYIGIRLANSAGQTSGVLAVLYKKKIFEVELSKSILTLFAGRITAELERLDYEKELKKSQNDLSVILDSTLKAFILINKDYKIRAFNRLAGSYYKDYFGGLLKIGDDFMNYYLDDSETEFKRNFYEALRDGFIEYRKELIDKNDDKLWIGIKYEAAKNKKNKIIGVVYSFENITEKVLTERKLEEESLRNSILMSNTLDGIHLFDLNGKIIDVNDAFAETLGFSKEELIGSNIKHYTPDFEKEEVAKLFSENESEKENNRLFECEYLHRDGRLITLEITQTPILINEKRLIFRSTRDVTEKKQYLNEIRKLSAGIEQSPASVMITDIEGTIQYVNKRFCELTGYSADEVIGNNPRLLKSETMTAKDYRELWKTILEGKTWSGELCNKKKSGELYWELASISPIYNNKEEITSFIAVKEDITERKQLLDRLSMSEQKLSELLQLRTQELLRAQDNFKQIAERSSELIIQLDAYRNILYANPVCDEFFNFRFSEYRGRNLADLPLSSENMEKLNACLDKLSLEMRRSRIELLTGKDFYIEITSLSEVKDTGQLIGYFIFGHEFTERKKAEDRIKTEFEREKELNKLRSEFFAMVSHDFRTPLTSIHSTAELLELYGKDWSDEEYKDSLRRITESVHELIEMMEDLILISKFSLGEKIIKRSNVSLKNIIEEAIDDVKNFEYCSHEFNVINESNVDVLSVDRKLMKRIFVNLLSNAAKYSEKGAVIDCVLRQDDEKYLFMIKDKGEGIKADEIPKLFDMYFRGENVGSVQGSGLGLAVVKNAVAVHGGEISVASEIGKGTEILIELPKSENAIDEESYYN